MSKKLYYIHFDARKMPGVSLKIDTQIKEFERFFDVDEINVGTLNSSILYKILACIPFFSIKRNYNQAFNKIKDPDYFYIRNTIIDNKYLLFLKKIKRKFPKAKIVIELSTHPHDKNEFGHGLNWMFFYKDFIYRHFYYKYTDRFVVYGDFDVVWKVKTIKTINGIDFNAVSPRKLNPSNDVNLIAVAQFQKHHGYERLICGLSNYYENGGERNVFIHFVGDGSSVNLYKNLAHKYTLDERVCFYGNKYGTELDAIYDKSNIAVCTLGFHRIGVKVSSALKTREYLAKGLPIVYSGIIDIIDESFPYQYRAPEDESPIDIKEIICLYDRIHGIEDQVSSFVIKYGKGKASIEKSLEPIIKYYNE